MVTKKQAMEETTFHTPDCHSSDGTPIRWRSNGVCKVWKTRPLDFQLPIKYGLRTYGYIEFYEAGGSNNHLFDVGNGFEIPWKTRTTKC